jgi:transposase
MTCMRWRAAAGGCTGRPRRRARACRARSPVGVNLQAWCVFLMVAHAVPVHRCAELIEALTGARLSPGFVHAMIARAAAAVAAANKAIRALIILARVICADETPIRVGPGPKTRKRCLLVACTRLLTYYFLGDRSLDTFAAFVFPDLAGVVVVHDRYQNYDAFPGVIHQLCCHHLIRDCQDAAETYPQAVWPGQIADALRGLIHAANWAREQGLTSVPGDIAAQLIHAFRHGVLAGLSEIPRRPGRKQHPCRDLLEVLRDRQDDVLRFVYDLRIPPTSNQAERDVPGQDPAEDLRAAPLRAGHSVPVRDPRLHLHRRQPRREHPGRPPRRDHRPALDAANPRPALSPCHPPVKPPQPTWRRAECLPFR